MATPVISGTTRTNLGPLTTDTWTYTCTEAIQQCSSCHAAWAAQTCISGTITDNQDCWPPRATDVPTTTGAVYGWGVYSPGIVCPGGYTSAVGATYGGSSDFDFQYPLTAGETAIGCCPKGGFLPIQDPNGKQTCVQFKPSTTFLLGTCGPDGPAYTPFSIGGTFASTQYKEFSVTGPLYQAVHQASDLSSSSASSSTATQSSDTTSSSSSNSSSTQSSDANPSSGKASGLSAGAIAGIVIGVALAVILSAAVAFCLLRRRRKQRLAAAAAPPYSDVKPYAPIGENPAELHNTPQWQYAGVETQSPMVVNPTHPAELANTTPPAELGASTYGGRY
ncbi:hypothetical protein F4825DRAFT_111396 [Nemania diffusa]|nr:hypothetical protein F4825DRAFT_111396 [Nemania diffusa]